MAEFTPNTIDPNNPTGGSGWIPLAKISPPDYTVDLIERSTLLQRVENQGFKLLLIHAPAGFGKTVLLSQYYARIRAAGERVCWVGIEDIDTNPYALFAYTLYALLLPKQQFSVKNLQAIEPDMSAFYRLRAFLEAFTEPLTIVWDDYQFLESPTLDPLVDSLIKQAPDKVRFVIGARHLPTLKLTDLKLSGALVEVNANDLLFSNHQVSQVVANDKISERVYQSTGGWPLAVQLAKLSLTEFASVGPVGDTRWVDKLEDMDEFSQEMANFLSQNVVKRLPQDLVEVLVTTSIVESLNGDLAKALCEQSACWQLLDQFDLLDALIMPLDPKRRWFKFHPVFHDYLQGELHKRGEQYLRLLHRRASVWYAQHNMIRKAVAHACDGDHEQQAADIILDAGGVRLALTAGMPVLQEVLSRLSPHAFATHERIALAQVWTLAKTGELNKARRLLDQLPEPLSESSLENQLYRQEFLFVSMFLMEVYEDRGDTQKEVEEVERLSAEVSETDHWFQGWINNLLCIMHVRRGNVANALEACDSAIFHYRSAGSDYGQAFMYLNMAMISTLSGNLNSAEQAIDTAEEIAANDFAADKALLALIAVVRAEICYEQGWIEKAETLLIPALDTISDQEGWLEVYARGFYVHCLLAHLSGQATDINIRLKAARATARQRCLPRLDWLSRCWALSIATLENRVEQANELIEQLESPDAIQLTWREIAGFLMGKARLSLCQGTPERYKTDLLELLKTSEHYGRQRVQMELCVLLALIYHELEDRDNAVAFFRRAVSIAEPEGYKMVFIVEGERMVRMLKSIIRRVGIADMPENLVNFISSILTQLNQPLVTSDDEDNSAILSEREIDVLRELAKGSVNKIIARNLDLSVSTVKFHLANVYKKLGVGSRTLAVTVARKKGLIR